MARYPIFLELADRRVVVIGSGPVAARKARTLIEANARVVIVTEKTSDILACVCQGTGAELIESHYSKNYLGGAALVIAATNKEALNKQIYKDCQELEILCNVADEPQLCDFLIPAVVIRGDLKIAVSTEGNCPAYAGHIRKKLEEIFTEEHGRFLSELEVFRKQLIEKVADADVRKILLGRLVDDDSFNDFLRNGTKAWQEHAQETIDEYQASMQI